MFPAQTSLIPAVVALTRFLEEQGLTAITSNYPYWYLGSTPFRYLTGPVVPAVLVFLHRLLPNFSLFEIILGLIGVVWLIGGMGVYLMIREMKGNGGLGWMAAVFYLLGPIVPFLFPFSDGVYLLAFSFLPFILLLQHRVHRVEKGEHGIRKIDIALGVLITIVILLDSLIIPTLVLGMLALLLATSGWQRIEERLKRIFLIFTFSFLISTFWYTPGYWLTLLGSPSFGGKGLGQVIVWLGNLLPVTLALTLAVFSVRFFKKRDSFRDFTFFWLFIFGFLTLIRFLSDPDFWQDWTGYGMEIQLGLALGIGLIIQKLNIKYQNQILKSKNFCILLCGFTFYILIFAFITSRYVLGTLQKDITQTVEYRVGEWLAKNTRPGEHPVKSPSGDHGARVFLSGTTAFWLNALFDAPQVRGGRDQVSRDQGWRQATWEIRDGSTGSPQGGEKSLKWLKELEVRYLVVHTQDSEEFYHDFVYPEKFEKVPSLSKIYDERGDKIYRLED